jgi:hypothetical protein
VTIKSRRDGLDCRMNPGDRLVVRHHKGGVLHTHDVDRAMVLDTILVVELEEHERRALGLEDGVAVILGQRLVT